MSSLSIVIPVYNQVALTRTCLRSLLENTSEPRELLIVDNHSTDETPAELVKAENDFRAKGWSFQVIRNDENRGFGRACNQGLRQAKGEFLAVLNNDTWLMKDWDRVLIERARTLGADMIGPHYDETPFEEDRMQERAERFVARNRGKVARRWVSILMVFSKAALDRLGLFDERFFVTFEDTDLRHRMEQLKMSYFQTADCYIWHHSKGTRSREALPSDYEREGLRLFMEKWGFDPRRAESGLGQRLGRRWRKWKIQRGLF